jgi:glutathione S-transferase
MPEVVLYHISPSFYSQIVRVVLWELGVVFEEKLAPPGPPTFDTYKPWYLKLNPLGTVPTLVHGEKAVPDSDAIMRYAVEHLSSVNLEPEEPERREAMEAWITALKEISVRELSYSSADMKNAGARVNRWRLKVLASRRDKYPDMAEIYTRKIDDIAGFAERAVDPAVGEAHRKHVEKILDELNALLAEQTWITGASYSLADTVWTVAVARFIMLHLDPLNDRPALSRWYARVKERPSFAQADIWESFQVLSMMRMVARRFRLQILLLAAGTLATIMCWVYCV